MELENLYAVQFDASATARFGNALSNFLSIVTSFVSSLDASATNSQS